MIESRVHAFATLLIAAVMLLTAMSCGGGGGGGGGSSSPVPNLTNVTLDRSRASSLTIGPAGGELRATGSNGVVYDLTIPAGALTEAVEITMVPVSDVPNLPESASVGAGVHLLPEGLKFLVPGELTMTLPQDAAEPLVPFAYDSDLQDKHLYPAAEDGSTITFPIVHFSGYAALIAALEGLIDYFPQPSARGDQAMQELVNASQLSDATARATAMRNALQGWLDDAIKPKAAQFQAISTLDPQDFLFGPPAEFHNELNAFDISFKFAILSGVPLSELSSQEAQWQTATRDTALHLIPLGNEGCSIAPGAAVLLIAPTILAWQQLGNGLDPQLERAQVLEDLCVQVAFDPNGGTDFPSGIQPGQAGTLSIKVGYTVNDGPVQFDVPFKVVVTPQGTEPETPVTANTGDSGSLSRQFLWSPDAQELRLDIEACLLNLPEVCQEAFVIRGTDEEEPGEIPTGTWQKNDHTWTFNGSTTQNRPTRFIIAGPIEDLGQPMGMYQVAQDSQGNPVIIPLYGVFLEPTQDGGFRGENSGTMFQGATGTVEVTGRVLENGWLRIRWEANLNHGESVMGEEDIPPFTG